LAEVEILRVDDRQTAREFLEFPYQLYRGNPYWVPPLRVAQKQLFDTRRHPFYRGAEMERFLARRNGRVAGRVAAILNRNYNEFHGEQAGFFGFLEMENDPAVCGALLAAARDWLAGRGARVFRGPVNPSTNYECGMLVEGFDSSPVVMMTYNPPYYPELMERAGWRKAKDLYAYFLLRRDVDAGKMQRVAERSLAGDRVLIRPIRMGAAFNDDVAAIWQVYNASWSRNWGFVPMTREEFVLMAKEMKAILIPDLVLVGEVKGRIAGFALALPDINQALIHAGGRLFPFGLPKILYYKRTIRTVRVIALGVVPEHRTAGMAAGFYAALLEHGSRLGIEGGEFSWVLEDNVLMNRSLRAFGAARYKTYRIYEWN
jgi:GNAT superfamily N-acetyltransferase